MKYKLTFFNRDISIRESFRDLYEMKGFCSHNKLKTLISDIHVQMSHRREDSSAINYDAVAFALEGVGVTIRHNLNYQSLVHINGQREPLDEMYQLENVLTLERSSLTEYQFVSLNTNISVTVMASTINVDVSISKSECCNIELGLCGTCSTFCSEITQVSSKTGSNYGSILGVHDATKDSQLSDPSEVIFYGSDPGYNSPSGGYGLHFIDATAVADQVALSATQFTTIAFYVKTCGQGCGGTVLSYSCQFTFSLSTVTGYFSLHFNDVTFETDLVVTPDAWQQLCLVFDRTTLLLDVYVIDPESRLIRRTWQATGDIFPENGSLGFGVWLPPPLGSGSVPAGSFIGTLDNVRVWER